MNIQIVSDIHLDYDDINELDFKDIIKPSAEILIIAGDLGNPFNNNYYDFLKFYSVLFVKIFIISGNHEYYYNNIFETDIKIQKICSKFNNIYFLNNKSYEYNGILFIGSTLWSNIPNTLEKYHLSTINDYRNIKDFTHHKSNQLFKENVDFIQNELKKNKKSLIITHHAPSFKCIPEEFKTDILNICFYSNLEYLFDNTNIIGWIYGHTHYNSNIIMNNSFIMSNCYRCNDYKNNLRISIN